VSGLEGVASEQAVGNPFDTSQNVFCAGSVSEGGQFTKVISLDAAGPSAARPSYLGSERYTGLLNPRELDYYGYGNLQNESLGTRGYMIFDFTHNGDTVTNIPGALAITIANQWIDLTDLEKQFRIGSTLGTNYGIAGNPLGTVTIAPHDSGFHYLTVISPAQFNNARHFTMRLTSTNSVSAAFRVDEDFGLSHVYQFLYRGDVTLSADGTGGAGAMVQALFFDDATVRIGASPPTNVRVIGVGP